MTRRLPNTSAAAPPKARLMAPSGTRSRARRFTALARARVNCSLRTGCGEVMLYGPPLAGLAAHQADHHVVVRFQGTAQGRADQPARPRDHDAHYNPARRLTRREEGIGEPGRCLGRQRLIPATEHVMHIRHPRCARYDRERPRIK